MTISFPGPAFVSGWTMPCSTLKLSPALKLRDGWPATVSVRRATIDIGHFSTRIGMGRDGTVGVDHDINGQRVILRNG